MMSRELCLEKLEQFILDESRIITYKLLSQELKMHTNTAKQYLSDFFSVQKSKNVLLQATYFLAGITDTDGKKAMKALVVSHKNLEEMKKSFSEVTSCHVYSISKKRLDECSLLLTERHCNKNIGEMNKYSAIKHPTIETKPVILKKTSAVNNDTKSSMPKKQESAPSKNGSLFSQKNSNNNQVEKKNSYNNQVEKKNIGNGKTENTSEEKVAEKKDNSEKPKVDPKSQKSNSLASMWQKKEEKQKDSKSETTKPEAKGKTKSPAGSTKNAVAKNNIMSMFSKQAAKNSTNPKKELVTPPVSNKEIEMVTPKEEVKDTSEDFQNNKGNKHNKRSTTTKRKSKSRQSKKAKDNSDDESDDALPKKKKHRRICTFEDSDSESENEEAQDKAHRSFLDCEDPLEPSEVKSSPMLISDEEEPIPPTPPMILPTRGRKKVLKTVQKTFQDEDGFFVTKQQKELVSASESDEDSKPSKTSEDKTPNLFTYRKQTSLTSFFK